MKKPLIKPIPMRIKRKGTKELNELVQQIYPNQVIKYFFNNVGEQKSVQGWWLMDGKLKVRYIASCWQDVEKKLLQAIARKQKREETLDVIETKESAII